MVDEMGSGQGCGRKPQHRGSNYLIAQVVKTWTWEIQNDCDLFVLAVGEVED